jgi:three-Cys-motif partner protein
MSPPGSKAYVEVRAAIVAAYLEAWAGATLVDNDPPHPALPPRLVFIDLNGGPGSSLPNGRQVLGAVAAQAVRSTLTRDELVLIFNGADADDPDDDNLLREMLAPAGEMAHRPQLVREHPWERIGARLDAIRPVATLAYVEPVGYTGLAAGDAWRCLERAGTEVFLALRYPLLNMGVSNADVAAHLDGFWGDARAAALRDELPGLPPATRLECITAACAARLEEQGARHVLVFRLSDGHRCQELLIHATGDTAAYARAKEVLSRFSTGREQGVPDYTYDPSTLPYEHGLLLTRPLDALADELGRLLAGQVVTPEEIYRRHHTGRPYVLTNYREALALLSARGRAYKLGNRVRVIR